MIIRHLLLSPQNEWVVCPLDPYFEVNAKGQVRCGRTRHVLKLTAAPNGYLHVQRVGKDRTAHSLVASAFLGKRPDGMDIHHLNGDKADNRYENLAYVSRSENVSYAYAEGLVPPRDGERNPCSKLTGAAVRKIRFLALRLSRRALASLFGVSSTTITRIVNGAIWGGE